MDKLLTIVIPSYNMQAYLHRCLDSLIVPNEQMALLEVLVINDGSKDKSSAIAHEYETKYPSTFRVIDKENGNYGSCINRGLVEASGKYIKVLDADDWYDTKNFEAFIEFLKETDVDLVVSDFSTVTDDGVVQKIHRYNIPDGKWKLTDCESVLDMWMHAVTYRTAIFKELQYHQTEGISYTDQEWIFAPMSKVKTLSGFPYVVYNYLVGRSGQTVDPLVFARNISQEIASWKAQQSFWERTDVSGKGDAENYMWFRLKSRAVYIETNMILNYRNGYKKTELMDFDDYVLRINPILYKQMNDTVGRKGLNFKFIRFWRIGHNRPLTWFIYKVESVFKRRFLKI